MDDAPRTFSLTSLLLILLVLSGWNGVEGSGHHGHHHGHYHGRHPKSRPTKLFVFGDSYADTGNSRISKSRAWKIPYGVNFPGRPAGRFSNGRVFADYFARLMGVKSPIPYRFRNIGNRQKVLKNGMNFAYGGTGVFDTRVEGPNLTTQIGQFQQLLHDGAFTPANLQSSTAFVHVAGNDYIGFLERNPSLQGIQAFTRKVIDQIVLDLRRIHSLGVKKITLAGVPPLGCLPRYASLQRCNDTLERLVNLHDSLLKQAVAKLNNETKNSTVMLIDMAGAFMTVFKNKRVHPGSPPRFQNPFKSCCAGVSGKYKCGDKGKNGELKYSVCHNPEAVFFWDDLHPTQAGWDAVYAVLRSNFKKRV